jgi:hypothetical protein
MRPAGHEREGDRRLLHHAQGACGAPAPALGDIAPEIRQAWRDGAIDEDCAQEFCRLKNHKDQLSAVQAAEEIPRPLCPGCAPRWCPTRARRAALVNFVGRDAYRGARRRDATRICSTASMAFRPALAAEMADERLEVEALRLTSMEGWKWAKRADEMPGYVAQSMSRWSQSPS